MASAELFDDEPDESVRIDFIVALHSRNLIGIIETVCYYAGYEATANLHLVCKAWNEILTELGIWDRGFDFRWRRSDEFRRLCRANGWTRQDSKRVTFAMSDFKSGIIAATSGNATGPMQRIFLGGIPNVFVLHREWLIAGMKNGLVKLWKREDVDPQLRGTCQRILVGHREEIIELAASGHHLASYSVDCSNRIWDLGDGVQVKAVEKVFIGDPMSGYGFTFVDGSVFLCYDDNYLSSINFGFWNWQVKDRPTVKGELRYGLDRATPAFGLNRTTLAVSFPDELLVHDVSGEFTFRMPDQPTFDTIVISDNGRLVLLHSPSPRNFSLFSVDLGSFVWSVDNLFPGPSTTMVRSTLTEFGFCANLDNRDIAICPIDELVRGQVLGFRWTIKFAQGPNLKILPRLIRGSSLSPSGRLAFLVADSEEILFCDLKKFDSGRESLNFDEEESLC